MPPCCRQMWLKLTDLCTLLIECWAYHTPQYWVNWKLIPWWGKQKGITIHCQLFKEDFPYSDTYKIGQFSHFNDQLNNTKRRYTFFVPRDKGWQKTELDYPSVHKKLFMADFSYHVSYICHCSKGLFIYSTISSQRTFWSVIWWLRIMHIPWKIWCNCLLNPTRWCCPHTVTRLKWKLKRRLDVSTVN